ncbi:MAG: hypothetical protein HQ581_16745 [Planctomycetes bacterium]|nr:hypothetical protein [Planctomycetota bacterium]
MDDRPSESGKQDDLDTARTTLPEKPAGDGQDQVIVDAEPILADERIPADEEVLELGEAAVLSDDQPAAHDEEIILAGGGRGVAL